MHYTEFLTKLKEQVLEQVDILQEQYESQMKMDPLLFPEVQSEEAFHALFNSMYE